jgi:ssDNA-binding Zn-finger/Zn-ribbon topoisomerase 1
MKQHPDGNLPLALHHLEDAINDLFDPHPHQLPTRTAWAPSLYAQLAGSIGGGQGNGHQPPGSTPPVNLDACQLKNEIDTALTIWKLDQRRWRPQDCKAIDKITHILTQWSAQIRAMIDPPRVKELAAECPNCRARHVRRLNASGDLVNQPALQIAIGQGCTCLKCRTVWPPERYELLCRVLGFEAPRLTSM